MVIASITITIAAVIPIIIIAVISIIKLSQKSLERSVSSSLQRNQHDQQIIELWKMQNLTEIVRGIGMEVATMSN